MFRVLQLAVVARLFAIFAYILHAQFESNCVSVCSECTLRLLAGNTFFAHCLREPLTFWHLLLLLRVLCIFCFPQFRQSQRFR